MRTILPAPLYRHGVNQVSCQEIGLPCFPFARRCFRLLKLSKLILENKKHFRISFSVLQSATLLYIFIYSTWQCLVFVLNKYTKTYCILTCVSVCNCQCPVQKTETKKQTDQRIMLNFFETILIRWIVSLLPLTISHRKKMLQNQPDGILLLSI